MEAAASAVPAATWFPVLTLVLGIVLKGVFDALADGRARKREVEARRDQRRETLAIRRAEFERTTLLQLQEAVARHGRAVGRSHYEDVMAVRSGAQWRKSRLSDEVNNLLLQAQNEAVMLRERVRDDRVRELAAEFSSLCTDAVLARDEESSMRRVSIAIDKQRELHDAIGSALRRLDTDEFD